MNDIRTHDRNIIRTPCSNVTRTEYPNVTRTEYPNVTRTPERNAGRIAIEGRCTRFFIDHRLIQIMSKVLGLN